MPSIKMKALNRRSGRILASNLILADSLLRRMKGLLGRKSMDSGEGLWIKPCKSVHTFGMNFPIDVLFLDQQLRVIAIARELPSNRLSPLYFRAASVLELPSGTVDFTATATGDSVSIT